MKTRSLLLLAALLLCACGAEPTEESAAVSVSASETVSSGTPQAASQEAELSCMHNYGDEPVEIVGNLYVYECADCGERKVVPQGTLIGGEE